jgi:hypothetical protein
MDVMFLANDDNSEVLRFKKNWRRQIPLLNEKTNFNRSLMTCS